MKRKACDDSGDSGDRPEQQRRRTSTTATFSVPPRTWQLTPRASTIAGPPWRGAIHTGGPRPLPPGRATAAGTSSVRGLQASFPPARTRVLPIGCWSFKLVGPTSSQTSCAMNTPTANRNQRTLQFVARDVVHRPAIPLEEEENPLPGPAEENADDPLLELTLATGEKHIDLNLRLGQPKK